MVEIRRIRQQEAEAVAGMWDRMARETPDGGPLQERGRRNIAAMLVLSASSDRAACLVAVDGGEVVGFVLVELIEDGLLPGRFGSVEEHYARGDTEVERALARAGVAWLAAHGVHVIRTEVAHDEDGHDLWLSLGFQREAVRYATYPRG